MTRVPVWLALGAAAAAGAGALHGVGSPAPTAPAADTRQTIAIDAGAGRHPISPLIYGVAFGSAAALKDMGVTLTRAGGNAASLYNPEAEARGAGRDWFFESMPIPADENAQYGARFMDRAGHAGVVAMPTVPMIGWAAKLGPHGEKLAAYAIDRYGLQWHTDTPGFPAAGDGTAIDGAAIVRNDPNDAARPAGIAVRERWLRALKARYGAQLRFVQLDNEPSRWHDIHRNVHPVGLHAQEIARLTIDYARMVKSVSPDIRVLAPEEWGWNGYRYSGFDQQWGETHGWNALPDRRDQTGGMDLLPWLMTQWKRAGRPVDVLSVHYYPQGGEYSDDVTPAMQQRRNRSTRSLWDRSYVDESWIADRVALFPRLRNWLSRYYYADTPIALTEYDWGAERHMNGATAQADVLGIMGRQGVAIASRWMAPAPGTPVYAAFKLFRNPAGRGPAFGDTAVAAAAPDPDRVAAFAALRSADHVLTVVAINKQGAPAPVRLTLAGVGAAGRVTGYSLANGRLASLAAQMYRAGVLDATLPPQSIALFELHPDAR